MPNNSTREAPRRFLLSLFLVLFFSLRSSLFQGLRRRHKNGLEVGDGSRLGAGGFGGMASEEQLSDPATGTTGEILYRTKVIQFLGRATPIVLQNDNGPCPLLAICESSIGPRSFVEAYLEEFLP